MAIARKTLPTNEKFFTNFFGSKTPEEIKNVS